MEPTQKPSPPRKKPRRATLERMRFDTPYPFPPEALTEKSADAPATTQQPQPVVASETVSAAGTAPNTGAVQINLEPAPKPESALPAVNVPSALNLSEQTLTGGLLAEQAGALTGPDALMTLTGGLNCDASLGSQASFPPDATLTGGIGNSARREQVRGMNLDGVLAVGGAPDNAGWKVGDSIEGKYDVTAIAGQGGMGVVYKVHHREWNIDMAVKTPLPRLVKDVAAKARFLREAQIWVDLGLHPNLVQCWYVRELGGLPRVFVDYLAGGSLKDWIQKGRVGPGQWGVIIDLMVQACDGLGYAHEKGVVHRDIKPGNMLMSEDGRLCITDFGLVKIAGTDDIPSDHCGAGFQPACGPVAGCKPAPQNLSGLTRTGLSIGTPQYGAPEQWGESGGVDARADIYALGVVIYELCCGRRPFDESGKGEPAMVIMARHLGVPPPDPRTYRKDVPDPLAELALKCLSKNPADRPQTLAAVRQALAGAHEKIAGVPLDRAAPEVAESRASGLNNRAVSMWDLGRPAQAEAAWNEALDLDPRHAESIYNSSLLEYRAGKITDVEAAGRLREAAKVQRKALLFLGYFQLETCDAEAAAKSLTEALSDSGLAGDAVAWRALGLAQLALERFTDAEAACAKALALMPGDETTLLAAAQARAGSRAQNGKRLYPHIDCVRAVENRVGSVRAAAVSPDGLSLFSNGTLNSACQFEIHSGRQVNNFGGNTKQVLCVAVTPDGRNLVSGGEDSVLRMWALDTGMPDAHFYGKGHIASITALAISPDSRFAVTGGSDKSVRLWELEKAVLARTLWGHDDAVCAAAFSPGGEIAVSGGNDAAIRIWEMPAGTALGVLKERVTAVKALAFSQDGRFLFSAGSDGRILKWERDALGASGAAPAAAPLEFRGHRGTVNALAVLPSGRFLISGGDDSTVRIWDAETGRCLRTLAGHQGAVNAVAVTPDGTMAVSGASENLGQPLRLWNLEFERFARAPGAPDPFACALYVCRVESQDKSQLASRQFKALLAEAMAAFEDAQYAASNAALKKARKVEGYERDPRVLLLNAKLARKLPLKGVAAAYPRHEIEGHHTGGFRALVIDGHNVGAYSAGRGDKAIGVWDLPAGTFRRELNGHRQSVEGLAMTPDSSVLISACADFNICSWDLETGNQKLCVEAHRGEVRGVAIDRDGRLAATAGADGVLKLWEIATGRCVKRMERRDVSDALTAVRFMPGGRAVLTGGNDGTVSLWSIVTGNCTRTFPGHAGAILDLAVFADKPHILTAGDDKTLRLWDAENGQCLWVARDGVSRFNAIALGTDGRFIFTGGMDGPGSAVKVWEASNGKLLHTLCPHPKGIACLALSPDGGRLLTGSEDKFLRLWDLEWELVSTDPISALAVHPRKPATAAIPKKEAPKLSALGEMLDLDHDELSKPKPTIFLPGKTRKIGDKPPGDKTQG